LHFIGKNGPTKENPDPIPANASQEKASYYKHANLWSRIILNNMRVFLIG
jgi:hypothetical protein